MFNIKSIRKVSLSEVDPLLNNFQNDTDNTFYLDQFFFEKSHDMSDEKCKNYGIEGRGYLYFNPLVEEFPFLSSNYTNGVTLLKTPKDFLDDDTLAFLLKRDSSWNFEVKNLNSNFKVLVIDNLPCIFLHQENARACQKTLIAYACNTSLPEVRVSDLPLRYYPKDMLENIISSFSNYQSFFFSQKFTEYLDIIGEEYQYV